MRGKKAVAGALSALMISMSVPVPAIAEGIDEAQPAAIEQEVGEKAAEDSASEAVPEQAADDEAPAAQVAVDHAEDDVAAAPEAEDDAEEPGEDAQDEQATDTAVAAEAADVTEDAPATQAAGDSYETEAPAYTTADLARIVGSVSYRVNNGSANSTSVVSANNFASVSEPVKNNETGGWSIIVTLKADGTADDYGLKSWNLGGADPASLHIDEDASDLTITFETSNASDSTWSVATNGRASLVFTAAEQVAPAPTTPFDINDVLDEDNAVHYYVNGSLHATSIGSMDNVVSIGEPVRHDSGRKPYWSVDVTIRGAGATAADYGVPTGYLGNTDPSEWVYDASEDNDLTTTFVLYDGQSSWTEGVGYYALLHFKHEVPAPSTDDIAGMWGVAYYTLRNEDGSEAYTVTTQIKADDLSVGTPYLENGTWKVDVAIDALTSPSDYGITLPGWYSGQYKLNSRDSKFTFTMTRNADGEWTANPLDAAKLVFDPVVAPAFDIVDELNVYGTVSYKLNKADGTTYENNTYLVSADNIASVGMPYQTEDGCWAVDVTLKADATPDGYEVPNWALGDGAWKLDADASDLTMTFRTLSPEGTTWYCSGSDRTLLVFNEQVDKPGENPGEGTENPGEGAEKPGTGTENPGDDTKTPAKANAKVPAKDEPTTDARESASNEDALTQTGDPLNGLVAIAAAGTITLVAGLELRRRGGRDAR